MKFIVYTFMLLFISTATHAQSNSNIGHINMNEILQSLPEADSARAVIQKETADMESVYEEMQVTYNNLVNDYQNGLTGFTDLQRKAKEDEILDKQKRLQEFEQNANIRLQQRNLELMQPIYTRINQAISKIAGREELDYILDLSNGAVVFTSDDSRNINPEVIAELTGISQE
jgi:outer membrane protein